jgi:hypothetical protein
MRGKLSGKYGKGKERRVSLATLSSAEWYHHGCNILIAAALGEK